MRWYSRRTRLLALVVLIASALLLTGCGTWVEPAQARSAGEHVGEIRGAHTVGQTFVTQHDGLRTLGVLLATFARHNTHPVTFHLRTAPESSTDLRTVTVSAAEIEDNAYHRFSFAPIPDSHHKRYHFLIESSTSQPGDAITAWVGPADGYREGSLYVDGQAREGQLVFELGYSNAFILLGLIRDLITAVPTALVALALFLLPGMTLLFWLAPVWEWDKHTTLVVSLGLSAAVFPLLLLFSRPVGLHWSAGWVWSFLLVCAGLLAWRMRGLAAEGFISIGRGGWRGLLRRPAPTTVALWAVVALNFGVRWLVVRPMSVPMWGDSHQHAYIVQLMTEHGGLFNSWEPYSPYTSFTVHFGFHAAAAFFHWATGVELLRVIILVGQLFNGFAVLAIFPLAFKISGNRWAGVTAVLVAGLLMPMPMEYVNWGRYSQLAGQMILPVALWLLWTAVEYQTDVGWKLSALAGIAAAGMTLTYYRMPYYYGAFVLAWLPLYGLVECRGNRMQWMALLRSVLSAGAVTIVFILPWISNIVGGRLATAVSAGVSSAPAFESVSAEYRSWRNISAYVPPCLGYLSLIALVWSVFRRRWKAILAGLWVLVLASLPATRLIRLPGADMLTSFAIHIALYMPVALMVGWLFSDFIGLLAGQRRRRVAWGVTVFLWIAAVMGARQRIKVLDPSYALVSRADQAAMNWIEANVPSDATFLVNGFLIYGGYYAAGSDAGWWIPLLARRQNTMPPQYALFNETEAAPGYGRAVVQLVADLAHNPPTSPAGFERICEFGVTHIYIGQGQGKVAREKLTPYLIPGDLVANPNFELLYHEDRVWVFAVKDDACL